jgi:hypothetical protein
VVWYSGFGLWKVCPRGDARCGTLGV